MANEVTKALENHKKGYNCAQAVACAFSEQLGMDEKEVFRLMEPFGFGMGTMGTCGAISGMAAVIGVNVSDGNLEVPTTKRKSYQDIKALTEKFVAKNGSAICRELKGVDTGKVLRSCDGCIQDAVELLQEYLKQDGEVR